MDIKAPSILETFPPVTRLMTLVNEADPVNAADPPVAILKSLKLWNRLVPLVKPRVSGII